VVTLTLSNGLSASCNVTVKQPICVVSSYCQETESVYIPERKSTINYVIEFNEPVKIKQGGKIYITEADSMPNSKVYTNNNGALANLMEIENTDVMDYIDDNNHKKINLLMHLIDENNKLSLPSETDISIYFDNGVLEPESSYSKLPMTDDNKFIKLVTNSGDLYKLRTEPGYRFYNETYSFEHTGESFYGSDYNGYNSYEISDSFKKELNKRGVSWKTIWGMFSPTWTEAFSCNLQWGGSCSGMTILALLNKIDPQYKNNINTNGQHISNLYKFPKPSETRNIEGGLRDQINYLQALTNSKYYNIVGAFDNNFVSNIKNEEQYTDKYPDMLKTIVEKSQSLNTGYSADKAFVLSMHFLMKGTNEIDGHAVLPFYCEKQGDYYYIYCYDVNSKDMPICLRISSDYSELYSELYHEDSRIEMIVAVGYTNYSDIIKLVNNEIDSIDTVEPYDNNSTTCIQIEVNGDFTIYNKDYSIKYDNGQISGDTEIIKDISINNVSGIGNSTLIFELYGDDFSISNSGDKNLNCSFEGNGNNIAVVASNADSVSFNSLSGLSIEGDSTNYNALVSLDKSDKNYASISGSDSKNVKLNYDENNNIVFTSDNDSDAVVNIYNEIDLISTDNVIENNDIITVDNTDDNFIYGDVDNDGVITSSDASFALQKSLDDSFNLPLQDKTEDWFRYANVDGDNTLSANDAAFILQKSLDMSFKFEVEE
jgi:hypothetical protein